MERTGCAGWDQGNATVAPELISGDLNHLWIDLMARSSKPPQPLPVVSVSTSSRAAHPQKGSQSRNESQQTGKPVLFGCVANSHRSEMAEAFAVELGARRRLPVRIGGMCR